MTSASDARPIPSSSQDESPRTRARSACPICGGGAFRARFEEGDRLFDVAGRFRYVECLGCATVFQDPCVVEDDLPLLYPTAYFTHEEDAPEPGERDAGLRAARDGVAERVRAAVQPGTGRPGLPGRVLARSRWMRERAFRDLALDELIPRRPHPGPLLDVGCGTGRHMLQLAQLGWEVEGLEWDAQAAAVARRTTGRPVAVGDVHAFTPAAPLRAVLLNHVLEHLSRPVDALARIRELLAPDGRVVLVWPNPRSLGARVFGAAWLHWDPPRHLVLPCAEGLAAAARGVGYSVVSSRSLSRGTRSVAYHSRAIRAGLPVVLDQPRPSRGDRVLHRLEQLLLAWDAQAGEEAVLVLAR